MFPLHCSKKLPIAVALTLMALGCLMFGAGIIYCFLLPKSYKATVRIKAEGHPWDGRVVSFVEPYFFPTQAEKIQSKIILYQVISNLNLNRKWAGRRKEEPELRTDLTYTMLKRQIEVRQPSNTSPYASLIEISAWSQDPAECATIANEIARVYLASIRASQREMAAIGIRLLEAELEKQNQRLSEAQALVERLQQELKISTPDQTRRVADLAPDDKTRPYWVARDELETVREVQGRLKARIEQEKADALGEHQSIEIIDRAEQPLRPAHPNPAAGALLLILGSVSLVAGFLLLMMSDSKQSPPDLQFSDA